MKQLVLIEDIKQKLMGLAIDEVTEAHYSTESIRQNRWSREHTEELVETSVERREGKTANGRNRGAVDQVISTLSVENLVTKIPTAGL